MDALNSIAVAMAAIAFTWVGYFLGNFFPFFGKAKKRQLERKASGVKLVDLKAVGDRVSGTTRAIDLSPIKRAWKKSIDWLLEREPEETEEQISPIDEDANAEPGEGAKFSQDRGGEFANSISGMQLLDLPPEASISEDSVLLWHDRKSKKLFARVGKEIVDLDTDLSKHQHGTLSMLLVDLQDKIGLPAAIKAAISEGTDKAYAEKDKQTKLASIAKEEPLKPPSFNPVKSLINYVKADVPKLEDKPESIPSQINSILQGLIEDTPFEERGISVADWPSRGVVFIVGINVYEAVEEIPDEQIQNLIKLAVKKWEESQTEAD